MTNRTRAFTTKKSLDRIKAIMDFMGDKPTSLMQIAGKFEISRTSSRDFITHLVEFGCVLPSERIDAEDFYVVIMPHTAGNVVRHSIEPIRKADYIKPFFDTKALPRELFGRM